MNSTAPESSESARITRLGEEIEALVARGAETARFEFTVRCSLAANDRKSQVDFAKTIQGIANCLPADERVYVIGADQKNKCFVNVENPREFDAANVGQILGRYLDPVPVFASYPFVSKSGQQFVAVSLATDQPRPIVAKRQASDDKTEFLRAGDVWIKKNTGLTLASRVDLEEMYAVRMETEAERRSQQRFAISRDALEATLRIRTSSEPQTPTEDLILGPDPNYEAYVEQLFASQDELRFRMLLTVLRRSLIERWHAFKAYGSYSSEPGAELIGNVGTHFTDIFQPTLRRLVHLGLLLLEYRSSTNWFENVVRLIAATFLACTKLEALSIDSRKSVGIEIVLASRLLGSYVTRMDRLDFLPALLHQMVPPIGVRSKNRQEPLLFWPVRQNVAGNDRVVYAWEHCVKPYWLRFFGSDKSFLDAACVLEFILLFNSDLSRTVPAATHWLGEHYPQYDLTYSADLWRHRIDSCVPLAERIYEAIATSPDMPMMLNISVEQGVIQMAFPMDRTPEQRQTRFIQWLLEMETERQNAAFDSYRGFAHDVEWGPVLGPALRLEQDKGH